MVKLYRLGKEKFGLSEEAINSLILEDAAQMPTYDSQAQCIGLLYEMAQIAWSDFDLDQSELDLLYSYARHFGIVEEAIQPTIDFLIDCAKKDMTEDSVIALLS